MGRGYLSRSSLRLAQAELGSRAEIIGGEVAGEELWPCRSGDHSGVVGGKGERGKGDGQATAIGFGLKTAAEFAVGGDSARDDDAASTERFCSSKRLALEVADYGVLKRGDEIEGLLIAEFYDRSGFRCKIWICGYGSAAGFDALAHVVGFDVTQNGGFDTAEGEVEVWAFGGCGRFFVGSAGARGAGVDWAEGKWNGARIAVGSECVDPGAAGVAETEQLGDLVIGLSGGVVDGAAYVAIGPGSLTSLLFR